MALLPDRLRDPTEPFASPRELADDMQIPPTLSALSLCAALAAGCSGSHSVTGGAAVAGAAAGISARASQDAGLDIARDAADSADVQGAQPVQPSTMLCAQLASLQCGAEQGCCTSPGRDLETCQKAVSEQCAQSLYLDDIARNDSAGFDMEQASTVFLQFAQRLDACDLDVVHWNTGPEGLRSIFRGTIEAGQSCKPAQVLTSDRATQAAALVSCRNPETTACLPQTLLGEWTCTLKGPAGASCLTDDNCQEDAYCSNPEQSPLGECQLRAPDGTGCSAAAQCAALFCVSGECESPDVELAYCPT